MTVETVLDDVAVATQRLTAERGHELIAVSNPDVIVDMKGARERLAALTHPIGSRAEARELHAHLSAANVAGHLPEGSFRWLSQALMADHLAPPMLGARHLNAPDLTAAARAPRENMDDEPMPQLTAERKHELEEAAKTMGHVVDMKGAQKLLSCLTHKLTGIADAQALFSALQETTGPEALSSTTLNWLGKAIMADQAGFSIPRAYSIPQLIDHTFQFQFGFRFRFRFDDGLDMLITQPSHFPTFEHFRWDPAASLRMPGADEPAADQTAADAGSQSSLM